MANYSATTPSFTGIRGTMGSGGSFNSSSGSASKSSSGAYGGIVSGLGQIASGLINAKRIGDTANFNSQMLDLDKRLIKLASGLRIKQIREQAMSLFSTQRSRFAKSGLAIEGGQAAVMAESLKQSELDVIYEEINADLGVGAISTQQSMISMKARSAQMDEYINIGSSILGNISKYKGR